jgi:carbon storage regulator CsrA
MLVLSRKLMERIQIGDSVVVTVLEIQRNNVQIGIDAPRISVFCVQNYRTKIQERKGMAPARRSHHRGRTIPAALKPGRRKAAPVVSRVNVEP